MSGLDLPTARLIEAGDVIEEGPGDVTVVIAYESPDGIRKASLGRGDLRIVGPGGFHEFPELASVKDGPDRGLTASYRVAAPAGKWRQSDQGVYKIEVMRFEVADTKGNHVPATVVGEFRVLKAK